MDTNIVKFWTKDRYFSDKVEQRIGRVTFFLRFLGVTIMMILLSMALGMWAMNLLGFMFWLWTSIFPMLMVFLFALFTFPMFVSKRCHDFNHDGKIFMWFTRFVIIVNFVALLHTIYLLYTWDLISFSIFSSMLHNIAPILSLLFIPLFLYLLFRPGTSGPNNYGEVR